MASGDAHDQALKLMKDYAMSGDNADIKAFAQATLPKVQMHLEMIRDIDRAHRAMRKPAPPHPARRTIANSRNRAGAKTVPSQLTSAWPVKRPPDHPGALLLCETVSARASAPALTKADISAASGWIAEWR